ncbi:hypothetical protein BDN70DRAFT_48718 [Pholiota conissans]|uniref:Uncharacterized protein n=1 Tax=Pholiota conissans TaxID=109636 RepID=A0A9P5YZC9_9AGAR|nr:hypothetical protein BDN70DRAFT_48718 [Pholiota conissans]
MHHQRHLIPSKMPRNSNRSLERRVSSNLMNQVLLSPILQSLTILELSDLPNFPAVTIPHLVKLQIKFQHQSIGSSFDKLTLPSIEDIRVVSIVGNLIARLTTMISRSNTPCQLKSLSVRTGFVEPGDLWTLLKLTPQLRNLDTTITRSNNFIDIASLAYKGGSVPLVPLLETCKFYVEDAVSAETSQALNELAALRCELENDSEGIIAPDLVPIAGEVRPLKNLYIYFDATGGMGPRQQAELEGWRSTPQASQLSVFKTQLVIEVPNLVQGGPAQVGVRVKPLSKKALERVSSILDEINAQEFDDPVHIYASGIHFTLHSFSQMPYAANSEENKLCQRASDILETWHPLFLKHLSDRHWTFKGPLCLGYIPSNDAIRKSEDALDVIYGLKDEMPLYSIFWPTFMAYT